MCCLTDDHSRVLLSQIPGKPKQLDYINANFVNVSRISSFQCLQLFSWNAGWQEGGGGE